MFVGTNILLLSKVFEWCTFCFVREVCFGTYFECGYVVLLNSLSIHKIVGVLDPIFERFVWFLSIYFVDFNFIELVRLLVTVFGEIEGYTF